MAFIATTLINGKIYWFRALRYAPVIGERPRLSWVNLAYVYKITRFVVEIIWNRILWIVKKNCNHLCPACHNHNDTMFVSSCCLYWFVMYFHKRNCTVYQWQQIPFRCDCITKTSNLVRMIRHHKEFKLKSEGPASDEATVFVIDKLPRLQTPHALGQLITFPMDWFMRNRSVSPGASFTSKC